MNTVALKHPSFRITHFIEDKVHSDSHTFDIVEAPTLKKATALAEWYYKEWLKVNP
jgi:hypothetical protein